MRKLLVALFLLFPVIASAAITISPARVAYNTEGQILSISGSFRPGNVATLVDFTYTDGGVAEVVANSVTSELITCEIPLSVTGQPGPWAVSVVFVDDNGVRTDDGATLFIFANLPPILNVPEVLTAEATSASGAAVDFSGDVNGISFVDPPPAPTISCTPASGSTFALGTTPVSCTATDSFGSTHGSFKVFVGDTTGPVITVPAPFTTTNPVTYTVSAVDAVDGTRPVTCSPASGTTFPNGVTTVQCSSTDLHDNTSFASFQVSVGAPPAPTLTLPANMTAVAADHVGVRVAYEVTADQDAAVVCTPESGSFFNIGTTTVSCTATNSFNVSSTGSFTITVIGDPRPILIVPNDITVDPAGPSGTVVTYTATATDGVDGSLTPVCTPPSGSTFAPGATLVQCSVTNSRGYSRFGAFYVFVRDGTPPVLTLPTAVNVASSGSPDGTVVNYTASAHDAVDGDVAVSCEPDSGTLFPDGETTVQCRAVDLSGNIATGSFIVTVGDTQPPVISFPPSVTAEATSPAGAFVTYVVTAVDNFDGAVPVVCAPASGSTFHLGTTQVTCTSRDSSNNVAMIFFNVFVVDTTPPTILILTPTPSNIWPENHKYVDVTIAANVVDNSDTAPVTRIISVTANQPILGPGSGNTTPDWEITGDLTVKRRAERTNNQNRIYTLTVTSTDSSGNTSTATVQVFVSQTSNNP